MAVIVFGQHLHSEEMRIATVNLIALDSASELLILKSETGSKLIARKLVVDKLYEEAKRTKDSNENALCSESVTLNLAIEGEKQRVLFAFIKKITEGKYPIVINDSGAVMRKDSNVLIIDITADVKELLSAP